LAEGGLRKRIGLWQERLVALSARAEQAIDYDEEDRLLDQSISSGCGALARELEEWLARPRSELLKDGVRVVVAGPPNAGKSSLLNAIAGDDRAIVSAIPGTTRDYIEVPLSLGGIPVRLTDTAGLRDALDEVEAIGVVRSGQLVESADILLWLGEPTDAPDHPRLINVRSKADLGGRGDGILAVSSVTGEGLSQLTERIEREARAILPSEGSIALNRRQAAHIAQAAEALGSAATARDLVLVAEDIRLARAAFDRLTGRAGVEDVLDALFSRFCLGK
jgi:tRNA modification GTPase